MKYFKDITEAIGNTPLIELSRIGNGVSPTILAKAEQLNPGSNVKGRIGVSMVDVAEKEGLLKPGGTIVEPTSGNTGAALAMVAAIRGYKAIFTMPDKISEEKEAVLRAYGAEVVRCPTNVEPDDEESYYSVAKKIVEETPNAFSPNQYFNEANPQAHYKTTGPEIWKDTDGKVTHFVAGMGTGGTISGTAKYLKEQNSDIKIIGADPEGSLYHEKFYGTDGDIHQYKVEGIGEDIIPGTMDFSILDEVVVVNDKESFDTARRLVREEALLVGESAGTAVFAALETAKGLPEDDVVVVLLPDTGRSYLSTLFNDEWLEKNNLK